MFRLGFFTVLFLAATASVVGQEVELDPSAAEADTVSVVDGVESDASAEDGSGSDETLQRVTEQAKELASDTKEKVGEIAETLDKSDVARQASAGVLKPIYTLAESLSFPAFYWVAFTLMVSGAVSFAFQLVLGKVVVLANGSINVREILSDTAGLAISLIGLVLTTQAAAQNSTFAESPSSVLSAAVVGTLAGLLLYRWGQAEEVDAARGRKKQK